VTNNQQIIINWGEVVEIGKEINFETPIKPGLWYPDGGLTSNRTVYQFKSFFFHYLPALIIDFLLFCFMQKRL
jgi:fatty acyl-CoA reductase